MQPLLVESWRYVGDKRLELDVHLPVWMRVERSWASHSFDIFNLLSIRWVGWKQLLEIMLFTWHHQIWCGSSQSSLNEALSWIAPAESHVSWWIRAVLHRSCSSLTASTSSFPQSQHFGDHSVGLSAAKLLGPGGVSGQIEGHQRHLDHWLSDLHLGGGREGRGLWLAWRIWWYLMVFVKSFFIPSKWAPQDS